MYKCLLSSKHLVKDGHDDGDDGDDDDNGDNDNEKELYLR